jgi:uncharacterized protein (TIGR03790 family)
VTESLNPVNHLGGFLHKRIKLWGLYCLSCALICSLQAGGSGLNTVVVANQNSSNSCELANYFCKRRNVPPENVLHINWLGGNTSWSGLDFETNLLNPLLNMLVERQLTNQVDYVVLSMDIPFQTITNGNINSTTSALFYGLKTDGGTDLGVTNSYATSEAVFRLAKPASAPGFSFLTTMITADSLAQAKQLVDQGVVSDASSPVQPVVLAKTTDLKRNFRHLFFDNAIYNVKVLGASSILRTNSNSPLGQTGLLGYETGLDQYSLSSAAFVPGALADSTTSFGGIIFGPNSQTDLLAFIDAGAAGSYGTVAEPLTNPDKFPDPQVYFYQARGFSLAESYYQSVNAPYLGLIVGEPLASPFARSGFGQWGAGFSNAVLSGTAMLSVSFSAADASRPLQQVDLFVDGRYFCTLTNLPPQPGNLLKIALNGYPITCTVPANATVSTVATGLAASINDSANTNATKIYAMDRGDRIELQSLATNDHSISFYVVDTISGNSTGLNYRVTSLADSFPPRMIPTGDDGSGVFRMQVEIPTALHYVIQASTNLVNWLPIYTNVTPGLLDFQDNDATNYSRRFYRVVGPIPNQPPKLSAPGIGGSGVFQMQVESLPGQSCAVLASTNLIDWSPVLTNQTGGQITFVDPSSTNYAGRLYKALLVTPPPTFTTNTANGETLVRIDNAALPYRVEVSTNTGQWAALATNFAVGKIQTTPTSEVGNASVLSTFLGGSRPLFLTSEACGYQGYAVSSMNGSVSNGGYLQFTFTKTNGMYVTVGVTNQSGNVSLTNFAQQLVDLINNTSALQGSDGIVADDFAAFSSPSFTLRARSPGYQAALFKALLKKSSGLFISPSLMSTLTQKRSDLQSRNHLYVTAGASHLALTFPLDTTTLPDGHHELIAVAYEGSHVRTQTRCTTSVVIQNTTLQAQLELPPPPTLVVTNVFNVTVTPNTSSVALIQLFSTGGLLAGATNQSAAIFAVNGQTLGVGEHPFYAVVTTTNGLRYRTETRKLTLVGQ